MATTFTAETSTPAATTSWRTSGALRLWVVVLAFVGVGIARSIQVDVPFRDPGGAFFARRLVYSVVVFTFFALLDAIVRSRSVRPGVVTRRIRARWTPHAGARPVFGIRGRTSGTCSSPTRS